MTIVKAYRYVVIAGLILCCAGCATVFRTVTIDPHRPTSISLDAKQRMVIAIPGPKGRPVVCAEPSPDAFQALAASVGGSLSSGTTPIAVTGAFSQMVASLGERTPVIQLLRDGLYRACEAYMNGAITETDYRKIVVSYDEMMITMLALEILATPPPPRLPAVAPADRDANDQTKEKGKQPQAAKPGAQREGVEPGRRPSTNETAEDVHRIVRDYFCYQIGLKEYDQDHGVSNDVADTKLPSSFRNEVVGTLCSTDVNQKRR